jgi:ribonuclease HII
MVIYFRRGRELMTMICGIDEAGRGPLIGPMVIAGAILDKDDEQKLKAMGVKDSKLLSPREREDLFEPVQKAVKEYVILIVPPEEIDDAVHGKEGLNLNRLEAKKTAEILNVLKPDIVYIDSPSTNLSAYNSLIKSQLTVQKIKLITEHKADVNYPCAAAASILAKVTRDREIEKLKERIGIDFGSGYLSDPKTASFFDRYHLDYPEIFRKSWMPYKDKVSKKFQSTLDGFSASLEIGDLDPEMAKKLKKLETLGYVSVPTTSPYEQLRMKGTCTVTLYTNGNVLVQGKEDEKEKIERILGIG